MEKLKPITQEQWSQCNKFNREITEEFINGSPHLSPQSKRIYRSNLMIWFNWVRENLGNKPQYNIGPLEFKKFQNWLLKLGRSSSDVNNKRYAVSSLCNYIEKTYTSEYPHFKTCIAKGIIKPEPKLVHEKNPPTEQEIEKIIDVLEERNEWQKIAWLLFTYDTGCRRAESLQLLKDAVNQQSTNNVSDYGGDEQSNNNESTKYVSNEIRCKGSGVEGKTEQFVFSERTMEALKKWLDVRGEDDCPYMFISRYGEKVNQLSESSLNKWAVNTFSPILGRRFYPHILKEANIANA